MLAPCYLIHGGEPLQTKEIIAAIRHAAAKEGYNKYEVFELNAQFVWEEFLNKCQSLDLFAERTLMELRLPGETVNKQGNAALESILQQQDSSFCFIISASKLKPQTLNSSWVQHIQKKGQIKVAKPIPTAQWSNWVSKRLTSAGFTANNEVITCIAKCYEGNLPAAAQCIEKLSTVLPPGSISLQQIKPFIEHNAHFSIFELCNAALNGDGDRTFRIFNNLKNEGLDPVLMLWGVTREIRNLVTTNQTQRFSKQTLEKLLHQAKIIDSTIKGMQPGDAWDLLLAMYMTIAGNEILTTEELYL